MVDTARLAGEGGKPGGIASDGVASQAEWDDATRSHDILAEFA